MLQTRGRKPFSLWPRMHKISLCFLLFCFFLLSACSGTTTQGSTPPGAKNTFTPTPTTTITMTQKNEGSAELQTFQQWIALMQQYHGDVTTYSQQYSSDQQALQSANNSEAYTKALQALDSHVAAIRIPAMKAEGMFLFQELQ